MAALPSFSLFLLLLTASQLQAFEFHEATVDSINQAFAAGHLTSRQLVEFYLDQIRRLNPLLRAVIEVSPDALREADRADAERSSGRLRSGGLHGIPVLLKENIGTRGPLNTTAGSFALLGSFVPQDAGVVGRLRRAGAVILGTASLSEWAHFRGDYIPNGWSARGGQGRNPYNLSADPCGSSSGSGIAAAANMAAVTLGTETDGSILCPSTLNSVVGIKPTVGLTSRAGVIPISPRQDSVGPICRTVSDAVQVLEVIAGYDARDSATVEAVKYIPKGGYKQFLKIDGLKGKRLGILKDYFNYPLGSVEAKAFEKHFQTMRNKGAILIENLQIPNMTAIETIGYTTEQIALSAEFKLALNSYLSALPYSPVRTLADVIDFNKKHKIKEKVNEYGQDILLEAENTTGIGPRERDAIALLNELSVKGLERLMAEQRLDAIVTAAALDRLVSGVLAFRGYPGITVPAGYARYGIPFGICFGGLRGSDPKLIEIAYAFEQATLVRKPPELPMFRRNL
ncbi:probable amidase At4g34880 [Zingiber officinale]|uniref:probable amidase At4g34880 n=1 Tax=Zingiber officinale TaxID=94328 RepID=UPI001C4CAE17|nr:probable amidase At4g34880 [Zingiber officinale]